MFDIASIMLVQYKIKKFSFEILRPATKTKWMSEKKSESRGKILNMFTEITLL